METKSHPTTVPSIFVNMTNSEAFKIGIKNNSKDTGRSSSREIQSFFKFSNKTSINFQNFHCISQDL